MNKLIYTYGIIAGLIVSAMVSLSFVGIEVIEKNGELFGYSSMIIAFSTIFIGIAYCCIHIENKKVKML